MPILLINSFSTAIILSTLMWLSNTLLALRTSSDAAASLLQVRAVHRFAAGLVWETPVGARAPVDALRVLSEFMTANKVMCVHAF